MHRMAGSSRRPQALAIVEESFPAEPRSASAARALVEKKCRDWHLPAVCRDLALVVTELVANAVNHAGTVLRVRLEIRRSGVRVEVSDGSAWRGPASETDPLPEHGRGLALVRAIATRYGVKVLKRGKTVWAEIRPAPHRSV
jgi:anti-sigma regulatory factor (Ser/Thr protein kinase)